MPGLFWSSHQLSSFCFCMSLKTGCRIIGSLTTIICSFQLISTCHKLIELLERERRCMDNLRWEDDERAYLSTCSHIKVFQFMMIINFIIFVIGFNGSVLLLYGIKTKQPKLFLAWLIFSGMVILTNLFTILVRHNMSIVVKTLNLIILFYFFRVVRSYRMQLFDELNSGCRPVVALAFPPEPGMRVFLPSQLPTTASDYIKDDPPPPYPGLPGVASSASLESQPPPYSLVNLNYEGPPVPDEPSSSSVQPQIVSLPRYSENPRFEPSSSSLPPDASSSSHTGTPLPDSSSSSSSSHTGAPPPDSSSSSPNTEEHASSAPLPPSPLSREACSPSPSEEEGDAVHTAPSEPVSPRALENETSSEDGFHSSHSLVATPDCPPPAGESGAPPKDPPLEAAAKESS